MKKISFLLMAIMLFSVMAMFSGCQNDEQTYREVIEKGADSGAAFWKEEDNPLKGKSPKQKARYISLKCLEVEKPAAIVLIILGQLFGWIIFKTATNTPGIRKFALTVLIIGIPVLSLITVGGTMALARMFM